MPLILKGSYPYPFKDSSGATIDISAVKAEIYEAKQSTVVGSSVDLTRDAKGIVSFPLTGTYQSSILYEVAYVKESNGELLSSRGIVWIESNDGTYLIDDENSIVRFANRELAPQNRAVNDAQPIFFFWPYGSGKTLTVQRSINGGALVSAAGNVTDVGVTQTISGKYRYMLTYNMADRSVGSVAYKVTDASVPTQTGTLTVMFLPTDASLANQTEILNKINGLYSVPITVERAQKANTILLYYGEQIDKTVDTQDHRAKTISLVIETADRLPIATIPDNQLVKTASTVTFEVPSAVYNVKEGNFICAIRNDADDDKLESFNILVRYAPL